MWKAVPVSSVRRFAVAGICHPPGPRQSSLQAPECVDGLFFLDGADALDYPF
jgi:hypothetical protein